MTASRRWYQRLLPLVVLGSVAAGLACTEEGLLEDVRRDPFNAAPDLASGLLGYLSADKKLTTCGNCHVVFQADWEQTKHASAVADLEASGFAQDFCYECHTVNERGNVLDEPAGWNVAQDAVYQDVQCESCHGPGANHVGNPATVPLASATVGLDLTNGCGECHQGAHHPFVDEWSQSPHAGVVSFAAARQECAPCHRGQATLLSWGESGNYVERDSETPLPVTCIVCHDPHGGSNRAQLRFPIETTSVEEHLCARCHNRRTAPDLASSHGLAPHAPEAALLVGDAGWFPPGANINQGQIRSTHGSDRNPTLCAQCHVAAFEVTDPATGDFVFNATGHLFRPIPCLDAEGRPLPFVNDCAISTTARSFAACTSSGCHVSEAAALSALAFGTLDVQRAADSLLSLLTIVDPNLDAEGGEIDPVAATFTVAEGAFFNHSLAVHGSETFGTNNVIGSTVHNPFLVEALLVASIDAVEDEYAAILFPAGRPASQWEARLQAILDRVPN